MSVTPESVSITPLITDLTKITGTHAPSSIRCVSSIVETKESDRETVNCARIQQSYVANEGRAITIQKLAVILKAALRETSLSRLCIETCRREMDVV